MVSGSLAPALTATSLGRPLVKRQREVSQGRNEGLPSGYGAQTRRLEPSSAGASLSLSSAPRGRVEGRFSPGAVPSRTAPPRVWPGPRVVRFETGAGDYGRHSDHTVRTTCRPSPRKLCQSLLSWLHSYPSSLTL